VALLTAAATMAIFGLLLLLAHRCGADPFVTAAVTFCALPLLVPWLSARRSAAS
jgi:hypothetical protein